MFGNEKSTFHSGPLLTICWINIISETDNGFEVKLHCHVNHGRVWNVEFSIPMQTPLIGFFLIVRFSSCVIFTKQNFLIHVSLGLNNDESLVSLCSLTWWWRFTQERLIILLWKTWPYLGPDSAIGWSTNQIARCCKEQCCLIFDSNDAVD